MLVHCIEQTHGERLAGASVPIYENKSIACIFEHFVEHIYHTLPEHFLAASCLMENAVVAIDYLIVAGLPLYFYFRLRNIGQVKKLLWCRGRLQLNEYSQFGVVMHGVGRGLARGHLAAIGGFG